MNIVITANGRTLTKMKDGECVYSGRTLEELEARQRRENERDPEWAERYQLPLRVVTEEEALAIIEERLMREHDNVPPEEITAEDWHEMLNIMPGIRRLKEQAQRLADALTRIGRSDYDGAYHAIEHCQQIAQDALAKYKEANK